MKHFLPGPWAAVKIRYLFGKSSDIIPRRKKQRGGLERRRELRRGGERQRIAARSGPAGSTGADWDDWSVWRKIALGASSQRFRIHLVDPFNESVRSEAEHPGSFS
jgi:hypothetical protein